MAKHVTLTKVRSEGREGGKVFQVKSLKSSFEVICIPRKNQDKPQATWAQPMGCEYLNGHWGNLEGVFEPQGQLCKADAIFT